MGKIKPIRTEADYEAALARIDTLMDAEADTPEGEELDVLTDLVEQKNYRLGTTEGGVPAPTWAPAPVARRRSGSSAGAPQTFWL